jgi:gliding motility-associated-like protein
MLSRNRYILFFLSCVLYLQLFSQSSRSLIRFTENKNQWLDFIHYRAQLDGGALYVESNCLTYAFYDKETLRSTHDNPKAKPVRAIKTTGFKVSFLNSHTKPLIESSNAYKDYNNYFIGKDKSKWASNVKNYQKLLYKDLWANINLEILGQDNSVKYNFYVKPGGNPEEIQLHYDNTPKLSLHKGQLIIKTILNELVEHEPYAYQIINDTKVEVPCSFKLKKNTVSFSFPRGYNKDYELVIDPVLVFAASSGSTATNFGFCATYDPQGNLYSGGIAFDIGYPLTNTYDSVYNGNTYNNYNGIYGYAYLNNCPDVVITKYDATGTFLHYSTYLGGSNSETVTSLIVDANNNLYMHGVTGSSDFPITSGAYDNSFNGGDSVFFAGSGTFFFYGTDLYVAELSAGGNQLLASTFIGGSHNDGLNTNNAPYNLADTSTTTGGEYKPDTLEYNYGDQYRGEIQLDNVGNPVISSCSRSSDFPIKNGFDPTLGGKQDAVLFKFNPNLSLLQWSTFIGGSDNDGGYGLIIDNKNHVYTTGGTRSNDFPTKLGVYQPTYNGGMCDGYITKISQNGDSLLSATYIGTNAYDQSFFIQLDNSQNVYVYGQSLGNMPVISSLYSNPNSKQFVAKLNNNLSSIIYSTILGNGNGQINISPTAFLIDSCENVYISGWGGNFKTGLKTLNMPLTSPTIQSSNPDGYNFYLMQLSQNCNALLYATYYGGKYSSEHCHGGTSRYDKKGIVYQSLCTGCGGHSDFPVTPGAWPTSVQDSVNGAWAVNGCNNATFKIDFSHPLVTANYTANNTGCAPLTVHFTNTSINATSVFWNFGGGQTSASANPTQTYTAAGTYTASLIAYNATCSGVDTVIITITVLPSPVASFTVVYDSCINSAVLQNTSTFAGGTLTYSWNYGNGQTSIVINPGTINYSPGTYTASLIAMGNNGCNDSISQPLHFTINPVNALPDTAFCFGKSVQLHASGGLSYTWQPGSTLSNANIANPVATPTANTIYTVTITETDGAGRTCNFNLTDSIKLYPQTTAAFSYSVNSCGNTVTFTDSSYANITSWHWNFGDTLTDTIKNPAHSYTKPGTYTVTLVVNNQYNCPSTVDTVIHLSGFGPISISKNALVCSGKSIQLNASGGISYTWTPSYNLDSAYVHDPIATPTATTHYTLALTEVVGTNTCISTLHTNITVPVYSSAALTVYASPDTIIDGNSSQLSTSLSSGYIVWSPDYNLSNDSSLTPTASPHHTTTYNAVYIDPNGCVFRLNSVTIYVLDASCNENTVFVPNTFTPNGDGKNDVLYARSAFVTDIYFTVYDRWGEQVFATNDINVGWNGVFNGKSCNPDVFGYYVTFTCNDGKKSFKKGNVTLIR